MTIDRLVAPLSGADRRALAELLVDAVASGAAVSFLSPLPLERAEDWWATTFASADPRAIFLVAREEGGIAGAVQLHPAWAPNQPHRADVAKLLVRSGSRGAGLGARLMLTIEEEARRSGFRLLTLDARQGGAAERLYRRMGWTEAGTIPDYALDPDGRATHAAVLFYKRI
jgi:acetyltransferase